MRRLKSMSFLRKVWFLIRPFHKDLYGILVITTLFEIVRMAGPYLFGRILDLLVKSQGLVTLQTALVIVGVLAGVRIASLIIDHLTDWIILSTSIRAENYISTTAYEKMVDLSLDYHEKFSTGKKISLINRGTDRLIQLIDSYAFEFQPVTVQLLVTSVLIFLTNWRVGLIFTLSIFPFVFLTFHIFESTQKMREKRHSAYEKASGEVGDTMTNITVVKGFAQEERENEFYGSIANLIRGLSFTEFKKRMFKSLSRNVLIEIFYIVLLVVGLSEIRANALTIGGLVFLISLVERAYSNIYRLGRIYQRISDAKEPVDRLTQLMAAKSNVKNAKNPVILDDLKGEISFRHVTFAYKRKRVLKNVSFTVPAGSFTALVGRSGSGKSTIAKLLSRYYDPVKGSIIIDGQYDLRELDLDSFRKRCAVVFQDSPVPNRRIWEVISYSAGKKSFAQVKDRVVKAAQLAHAHEFIMELEDGYQTLIGERGVKLSGGQRQRLAIARALFAQPRILIMDEPTSHLDVVSESKIQQALEEISKEQTMTKIVIAHQLSTVQKAEQILVMEKGKLVERGNHRELLRKNGFYSNIVHQSELKG